MVEEIKIEKYFSSLASTLHCKTTSKDKMYIPQMNAMSNPLFANFPLERLITNRNIKNKYKFEVRNNVVIDCYESNQASAQRIMET